MDPPTHLTAGTTRSVSELATVCRISFCTALRQLCASASRLGGTRARISTSHFTIYSGILIINIGLRCGKGIIPEEFNERVIVADSNSGPALLSSLPPLSFTTAGQPAVGVTVTDSTVNDVAGSQCNHVHYHIGSPAGDGHFVYPPTQGISRPIPSSHGLPDLFAHSQQSLAHYITPHRMDPTFSPFEMPTTYSPTLHSTSSSDIMIPHTHSHRSPCPFCDINQPIPSSYPYPKQVPVRSPPVYYDPQRLQPFPSSRHNDWSSTVHLDSAAHHTLPTFIHLDHCSAGGSVGLCFRHTGAPTARFNSLCRCCRSIGNEYAFFLKSNSIFIHT